MADTGSDEEDEDYSRFDDRTCPTCRVTFAFRGTLGRHRQQGHCWPLSEDEEHTGLDTGPILTDSGAAGGSTSSPSPLMPPPEAQAAARREPGVELQAAPADGPVQDVLGTVFDTGLDTGPILNDSGAAGGSTSSPSPVVQLREAQAARREQGEMQALHMRMTVLHLQPDRHPLHSRHMGGMIDFEQCRLSLRKSIAAFDRDTKNIAVRYAPRPGQGCLTLVRRHQADGALRRYGKSQGAPMLTVRRLHFEGGSVQGAFACWRDIVAWSAQNPAHFCAQSVAGNGIADRTYADLATVVAGKRYFEHATSSNAYIQAVREERVRRVHLTDGGHSWCVYTFVVFEDAATEKDGESFMMWHAVSAHIPLDQQTKPENWFTIGVATKLKFATPRIACAPDPNLPIPAHLSWQEGTSSLVCSPACARIGNCPRVWSCACAVRRHTTTLCWARCSSLRREVVCG